MAISDDLRAKSALYLEQARHAQSLKTGSYFRKMARGYAALAANDDWLNGIVSPCGREIDHAVGV